MNIGRIIKAVVKTAKENPALVLGVVGAAKPLVKAIKAAAKKKPAA